MKHNASITVPSICDKIGRANIAAAVGVGATAVSNAAADNQFPARWFVAVKRLCDEAGITCPEHLFSFIPVSKTPEGAAS